MRCRAFAEGVELPAAFRSSSTQKEQRAESPRKATVQNGAMEHKVELPRKAAVRLDELHAAMEQKLQRFKDFESRLTNDPSMRARRAQDSPSKNRSPLPFRRNMPSDSMNHRGRFSYGGAAGARSCSPTSRNSEAWWPGSGPDYSWQSLQDRNVDACASAAQAKEAIIAERLRRYSSRKNEDSLECMHVTEDGPAPTVGRRTVPHMVPDSEAISTNGTWERRHVSPGPTVLEVDPKVSAKRSSPPCSPRRPRRQEKKHVSAFSASGYAAPPPPPLQSPDMLRWSPPVF